MTLDESVLHDTQPVWRRRVRAWARRYLPAEVAGLATALLGALLAYRITGSATTTAFAGSLSESVGYYVTVGARDLRRHLRVPALAGAGRPLRAAARTTRDLAVEFGPAEIVDSLLVRPALMSAGPVLTSHLVVGTLIGKVAADVAFYAIAISGYEFRTRAFTGPSAKGAPPGSSCPRRSSRDSVVNRIPGAYVVLRVRLSRVPKDQGCRSLRVFVRRGPPSR